MIRFIASLLKTVVGAIDNGEQYPAEEKMLLSFVPIKKSIVRDIQSASIGEYAIGKISFKHYVATMTSVFVEEGYLNNFGQVTCSWDAGGIAIPEECLFDTADAAKAACQANFDAFLLRIVK